MTADTLRRAAALMRERAEAATFGPWYPGETASVRVVRAGHSKYGPNVAMSGARSADRNFPHIASWHPAVALAVADWLDLEANMPDGKRRSDAFIVARTYLGEQS